MEWLVYISFLSLSISCRFQPTKILHFLTRKWIWNLKSNFAPVWMPNHQFLFLYCPFLWLFFCLLQFMLFVLSIFRASLMIFNQFLIFDNSSLPWCKFCSFCFTATSSAYKYVFTEFEIVGKSFIVKMNSRGPRTDPRKTTVNSFQLRHFGAYFDYAYFSLTMIENILSMI